MHIVLEKFKFDNWPRTAAMPYKRAWGVVDSTDIIDTSIAGGKKETRMRWLLRQPCAVSDISSDRKMGCVTC